MKPSVLTKKQVKFTGWHEYTEDGQRYRIKAEVRYDDQCGNGHNSFAITGTIDRRNTYGGWSDDSGGCIHEEIIKHFPHLAPYIKWHLFDSTGPMHYIANTVYLAGDRDHWGLRKGEQRQIRNGRTGLPAWKLEASAKLEQYVDSEVAPTASAQLRYVPWCHVGEGKERQLDAARRTAVWPEATDEELCAEPEELKRKLEARLPALLEDFQRDIEALGFIF